MNINVSAAFMAHQQYVFAVNLIIASQGFFLAFIILISRHGNRLAGYFLAAFIAIQSNIMVVNSSPFWAASPSSSVTRVYLTTSTAVYFLLGPLLYFYTRSMTAQGQAVGWKQWLQLPVAIMAGMIIFKFSPDLPGKPLYMFALLGSVAGYAWSSIQYLAHYQRYIHDNFSTLDDLSLVWLTRLLALCFGSAVVAAVGYVLTLVSIISVTTADWLLWFWRIMQFILVGVAGCRSQLLLFGSAANLRKVTADQDKPSVQPVLPSPQKKKKYDRALVTPERAERIWAAANRHLEEKSPFTDSELQLRQVAAAVGVSANDLSQVINIFAGQNFYDLVNRYRATKARELIESHADSDLSILTLAMEAGFSSTATFYKHFKKHFGITPSIYRKNLLSKRRQK